MKFRVYEQIWMRVRRWIISTDEGVVQLEIYPEPQERVKAYIWALWVEPNSRRKGIATELLKKAEEIAKTEGETSVWLEWDKADSSQFVYDWYVRQGYAEIEYSQGRALLKKEIKEE